MGSHFVRPETDRLMLSDGDWIVVRRRLNTGEYRALLRRSRDTTGEIDALDHGLSTVVAYLLDWSFTDGSGPIPLPLDPAALTATLDNLDPDAFAEIKTAITAHVDRQTAARAEAKKKAGATTSTTTSSSASTTAGPLSTSPN